MDSDAESSGFGRGRKFRKPAGFPVAVAPAAADDVMDEGMSQDEKHKRDKNNELHSKALKSCSLNMTILTLPYLASTVDVLSKLAAADGNKIDGTRGHSHRCLVFNYPAWVSECETNLGSLLHRPMAKISSQDVCRYVTT